MRRLQPVGTKVEAAVDRRALCIHVDIARQQQTLAPGVDAEHARGWIAVRPLLPAPRGKHHAIPLPARTALAQSGVELRCEPDQLAAQHPAHRKGLVNRRCASGMVRVGVADQHQIKMADTCLAHGRHNHALTDIELTETWTCVIQKSVIASAQQNGQALPYIQLQNIYLTFRH